MISWWCSAQGTPWDWTWKPYLGVWLLVLSIAVSYAVGLWWLRRRELRGKGAGTPGQIAHFSLGLVVLWLASDWPVGTLAAGYLVSAHAAQNLLYTLVVPPLLLAGTPEQLARALVERTRLRPVVEVLTRPFVALPVFAAVLALTHLPAIVDTYRPTQWGSFLLDQAWLVTGLLLWWPVVGPLPEVNRLTPLWSIGYLALQSLTHPAASLVFYLSPFPVYRLYELAPRVNGIQATTDQFIAGLVMHLGNWLVLGIAIVGIFSAWVDQTEAEEARQTGG